MVITSRCLLGKRKVDRRGVWAAGDVEIRGGTVELEAGALLDIRGDTRLCVLAK